jgi:hypothetical protein
MMEKLLVTMTAHNPIEMLMPCLEVLAKPGMTVIFLFQYPVDSGSYFRDHRITVESARHATAVGRTVAQRYTWEAQKERARQMIAPAVDVLATKAVRVEVHLCSGPWAKVINKFSSDKDIRWILTQCPHPSLMGYLSAKNLVPLGWSGHLLCVRGDPDFSRKRATGKSESTKDWYSWLIDCSAGEVVQKTYEERQ